MHCDHQSGMVIEVWEPTSYECIWTKWYVCLHIHTYALQVVQEGIYYV